MKSDEGRCPQMQFLMFGPNCPAVSPFKVDCVSPPLFDVVLNQLLLFLLWLHLHVGLLTGSVSDDWGYWLIIGIETLLVLLNQKSLGEPSSLVIIIISLLWMFCLLFWSFLWLCTWNIWRTSKRRWNRCSWVGVILLDFLFCFLLLCCKPWTSCQALSMKGGFFGFCSTFLHMEAFDQMFVASSHWLVTSLDIFKPLPKIQSGLFVLDVPQWCESFSSFDWKTTTNYNSRTGEKALTSFFFSARWEKYQVGCDPITCTHWQEVSSRVWGWSTLIDTTFCLNLVPLGWVLGLQCPIFKLLFLILHLIPVNV